MQQNQEQNYQQPPAPEAARGGKGGGKGGLLDEYGINLTQLARDGGIDPVIGRDSEIARVIEILNRRTKNNPVLTGEAGVGKTAVVKASPKRSWTAMSLKNC